MFIAFFDSCNDLFAFVSQCQPRLQPLHVESAVAWQQSRWAASDAWPSDKLTTACCIAMQSRQTWLCTAHLLPRSSERRMSMAPCLAPSSGCAVAARRRHDGTANFGLMTDGRRARDGQTTLARRMRASAALPPHIRRASVVSPPCSRRLSCRVVVASLS